MNVRTHYRNLSWINKTIRRIVVIPKSIQLLSGSGFSSLWYYHMAYRRLVWKLSCECRIYPRSILHCRHWLNIYALKEIIIIRFTTLSVLDIANYPSQSLSFSWTVLRFLIPIYASSLQNLYVQFFWNLLLCSIAYCLLLYLLFHVLEDLAKAILLGSLYRREVLLSLFIYLC